MIYQKLETRLVSVFLTSRCTLNCKYCGAQIPKFRAAGVLYEVDVELVKKAIFALFSAFDHIDHIDFTGGEPLLLEKDVLPELLNYTAQFHEKFGFMRVLTNGTLLPDETLLRVAESLPCPFDFYLDNYEGLSVKADEFKHLCDERKIAYKEIVYSAQSQYCDGWVDFGDLSHKGYTEEQAKKVYDSCLQAHHACLSLIDNMLYPCSVAPIASMLRKVTAAECSGVNLLSESTSLEKKREEIRQFGSKILGACHYCNGFDYKNAPRFPAAEQME